MGKPGGGVKSTLPIPATKAPLPVSGGGVGSLVTRTVRVQPTRPSRPHKRSASPAKLLNCLHIPLAPCPSHAMLHIWSQWCHTGRTRPPDATAQKSASQQFQPMTREPGKHEKV